MNSFPGSSQSNALITQSTQVPISSQHYKGFGQALQCEAILSHHILTEFNHLVSATFGLLQDLLEDWNREEDFLFHSPV